MAKNHDRAITRPVNPESPISSEQTSLHTAVLIGGGVLPTSGAYTADVWGMWFGRTGVYVTNHFRKLAVPYMRVGDQCYFNAPDVWARLKLTTFDDDPGRKHGGNRKA